MYLTIDAGHEFRDHGTNFLESSWGGDEFFLRRVYAGTKRQCERTLESSLRLMKLIPGAAGSTDVDCGVNLGRGTRTHPAL